MTELEKQLHTSEKEIYMDNLGTEDVSKESDEDENDSDSHSSCSSVSGSAHEDADTKFCVLHKWLLSVMQQTVDSSDDSTLERIIQECRDKEKEINNTKEMFSMRQLKKNVTLW